MPTKKKSGAELLQQPTRPTSTSNQDTPIISDRTWSRAECRAMELALGGGFVVLAVLEVIFKW